MKFGMNVSVSEAGGGVDFIKVCAKAGIKSIRLIAEDGCPITAEAQALAEVKAKAVLSLYRITPATAMDASATFTGESEFAKLLALYQEKCFELPVKDSLGVNLPEGVHYIMRVGKSQSRFGVVREKLITRMNALAEVIRKAGHRVVLPARIEDITGLAWHGFKCDVIDVEMMISKQLDTDANLQDALHKLNIPFWFGKAGIMGGYIMPAEQAKFLRKLVGMQINADIAFLWSEAGSPRWEWSKDGKFLVDILGSNIAAMQVDRVLTGNPVVAGWKQRMRAEV